MTIRPSPYDYDTETLQTNLYSRMTFRPSLLDYDYLDSRDYSLFYTTTVKASHPLDYDYLDSTDYSLLYTMTGKAQPVGL